MVKKARVSGHERTSLTPIPCHERSGPLAKRLADHALAIGLPHAPPLTARLAGSLGSAGSTNSLPPSILGPSSFQTLTQTSRTLPASPLAP